MPFIICVLSRHICGGLLVIHDFETIEKSYFTIDFIFAGSIIAVVRFLICDMLNLIEMSYLHQCLKPRLNLY